MSGWYHVSTCKVVDSWKFEVKVTQAVRSLTRAPSYVRQLETWNGKYRRARAPLTHWAYLSVTTEHTVILDKNCQTRQTPLFIGGGATIQPRQFARRRTKAQWGGRSW